MIDEYANILDKNDQSTHKRTNKLSNRNEYYDYPNTLYRDFFTQETNFSKNNNYKKKKKKHFNDNNLKNNRKEMLSYSNDIRGKNAQNMKKKPFKANAQSWNDCYKKNPVSAALKNKQEWLDYYYRNLMFSTKKKYDILENMKNHPLFNSKDVQKFKDKFNLK